AWKQHLRDTKQRPREVLASGPAAPTDSKVVVRQTAPPMQPITETARPIVRGQIPDETPPTGMPRFLPDLDSKPAPTTMPAPTSTLPSTWSPLPTLPTAPPSGAMPIRTAPFELPPPPPSSGAQVQLGQPIFIVPAPPVPPR